MCLTGLLLPALTVSFVPADTGSEAIRFPEAAITALPGPALASAVVRSSGRGCIPQTGTFDLDRGESNPALNEADLFFQARTHEERYLQPNPWGTAQLAVIGNLNFEGVALTTLQGASYGRSGVNASRNALNRLPPGIVLAVRTNQGRLSKVRINSSQGDFIDFNWVTFALPGEGPSPIPPAVQPCGAEQRWMCGTGQLPGDVIKSFRILNRSANELSVLVQHSYNPNHGTVYLGTFLLDQDGNALAPGFYPTKASPHGETQVRVPTGTGQAYYLLVVLYESYKSEAFVCRRFTYRAYY